MLHRFIAGCAGAAERRVVAGTVVVVLAVSCSGPAKVARPSPSTTTGSAPGELVFAAALHDNQDLYIAVPGSDRLTRITTDHAADGVPVWSPDGSKLAFVRFSQDGSSRLHVVNADGTDDHLVTKQAVGAEILPTWSHDGRRLVFAGIIGNGGAASSSAIYSVGVDGGALRQLTHDSLLPNDPVWSPDGSLIAFDVGDPRPSLYVMDTTGGRRRLVSPPDPRLLLDWPLLWSPDSSALAFAATGTNGRRDVYVVERDGHGRIDLTSGPGTEGAPAWSPDGAHLAFWSDRDGDGDLYVVARTGGSATRLTTGSHLTGVTTLAWSPDGRYLLVWNSPEQGAATNYVVAATGGELRKLTRQPGDQFMAVWRPVPPPR
jgi:TolB protein